ncbi:hypothetical protein EYZ11_010883 [Aspergillus tanneri]|uniref:Uncharacterized protein n=1 Tax=Aspergillus tanneri TaxID=1220188 RepID=A0A4S3J4T9_9EURO|nr:hypothetical protein EYZ11_010883 [Aspergillus tanneri]
MKSPQPATVYDVDEDDNPILQSTISATRMTPTTPNSSPYSSRTRSSPPTPQKCIFGKSICRGPIEEMVKVCKQDPHPFTIFTRSPDTSLERNEIQGYQFRKVFFRDENEILNPEAIYDRGRDVRLTAFISKKDEGHPDPRIYVEQRIYEGRQEKIMGHELVFGGKIQFDVEYVFPACGDEKRDLRLQIKSLEQELFHSYMRHAKYYGYDVIDHVEIHGDQIAQGLTYPLQHNKVKVPNQICLNAEDLQILLDAKRNKLSPGGVLYGEEIELLQLHFTGLGIMLGKMFS